MKLKLTFSQGWLKAVTLVIVSLITLVNIAQQALAHHPTGGKTPVNFLEGFLSGLAHPIIGLDHFAFVVASGLLAVGLSYGLFIPIGFVISTLIGTIIHLQGINLPFPEIIIATSVILFGVLLALHKRQNHTHDVYLIPLTTLAILAGIFHGYAYGESIVGAQMTPLVAYLAGFIIIQLIIAIGAFFGGRRIQEKLATSGMRLIGLGISAIGIVFLTSAIMG